MTAKHPATPATVALDKAGITYLAHSYSHQDGNRDYGLEASTALGLDPERVFKTLLADTDVGLVVGVVPVSGMLDLKALAGAVGAKRGAMAEVAVAERKTGYVVGGISPIGQKSRLATVLDDSALAHATIFVSGGRRGFDIELSPADLLAVTGGQVAEIRRVSSTS